MGVGSTSKRVERIRNLMGMISMVSGPVLCYGILC